MHLKYFIVSEFHNFFYIEKKMDLHSFTEFLEYEKFMKTILLNSIVRPYLFSTAGFHMSCR